MATLTATKQAIESRFATQWGTTTPIKYENVSLTEPTVNYVELYVRHSIEKHKGFDGHTHLFRRPGVISIHIRTKLHLGVKPALDLADLQASCRTRYPPCVCLCVCFCVCFFPSFATFRQN